MNTTAKTLVVTALIAVAGAAGLLAARTASAPQPQPQPQQQIVKLERVVILGKRAAAVQVAQRVEQLPRVVIEGRRAAPVQLARAGQCAAQTLC